MTQIFPQVIPDHGLTIAQPKHPHVAKRSTGGGESRIKLSNVRVGAKISLTFGSLETEQLWAFVQHWREARGTARDFQLSPVSLGAMAAPARALLLSTTWKYASPPTCIDICAGVPDRLLHTLEVELISQPRRVAAYINPTAPELTLPVMPSSIRGGIVTARAAVVGGLINTTGGISLPGAVLTTGQVWAQGGKFSTVLGEIPGVDISATAQVNAAAPTASATPAATRAGASVEGGKFTLFGNMPGGALTAGASVTGGVLTIPARNIGGAAITATATVNPGDYALSLSGRALSASAAVVGGSFTESDPYFSSVSLLLHFNGTNNSTTFIDSSSNGLTPSVVSGNVRISTAQSRFGVSSAFFDGETIAPADIIRWTPQALLQFPGDVTIEMWIYPLTAVADRQTIASHSTTDPARDYFTLISGINNAGVPNHGLYFGTDRFAFDGGFGTSGTRPIISATWQHVALCRSDSTIRAFVNGSMVASAEFTGTFRLDLLGGYFINGNFWSDAYHGYIDEFRITKGVARYTANFTPPTGPFPDS